MTSKICKAALIPILVLAVYGCATPPGKTEPTLSQKIEKPLPPKKPRERLPITEKRAAEAMEAAKNGLKDPDSAKFRNLYEVAGMKDDSGNHAVCGEVNAKNSYGGYVGYRRFMQLAGGKVVVESTRDSFNLKVIRMACD
ncbi:hypothetical protein [Alcanivorax jadensis]|jgi:hypothetical protein|uniref:hypothetical protein n=1 Tax=Alcanivorax jadensis TaxID=64988 RepID=UPI0023567C13|nr:hypothetical protein [Alcanivorax jadensis]|tara:strand:+ start:844 stop:1263 length:420 start_codon:yes stop_codon:yes gene_type:complete